MQVTEIKAEGLKREYSVILDAADIDQKIDGKLKEISQKIRMPGFRPGKVPPSLVRKMHGDAIKAEVLEETVNETSQKAFDEQSVRPAIQPSIDVKKFDIGEGLEYTINVEILPKIEVKDLGGMELEKLVADVPAEEIDEALTRIADQNKKFEAIEDKKKAAASGDAVIIDYVGKIDDVAFDGGSATDAQLVLGSGMFIPGFEDQLIGAKPDEDRKVEVDFPADYGAAELAGKRAVFDVKVKEVRQAVTPAIDDEFAKAMGLETVDALRDAVRDQIQKDYSSLSRLRLKRSLLDKLADSYDFEVPEGMVDAEFNQIWSQVSAEQGEEHDHAHDHDHDHEHDHDHSHEHAAEPEIDEEQRTEFMGIAERRVRLGLLLSEIGTKNNISVGQDEINREMANQARRFPGQEQQVFDFFRKNPSALAQLQAPLFEDKVVDFIIEMAKINERTVSKEELTADPDEEPETGTDAAAKKPEKKAASKSTAKSSASKTSGTKAKTAKKPAAKKKTDEK